MASSEIYGWSFLYRIIENDITSKSDILVAFVHWFFTRNGFQCLGVGEETTLGETEIGHDTLPADWNKNPVYSLRYVKDKKLYVLKAIGSDDDFIINLVRIEDAVVTNLVLNLPDVQDLKGPIETILPKYREIITLIKESLVEPFIFKKTGEKQTQSTPVSYTENRAPNTWRERERGTNLEENPLAGLGRADLNPFAQGGGMIYDPFRIGRGNPPIPHMPGRIPGARFDPLGPFGGPGLPRPGPGPSRGGFGLGPDPDQLPPPPGYDDMFM